MAQTPRSQSELEGLESSLRVPSTILAPHLKMLSARAHVTEQGFSMQARFVQNTQQTKSEECDKYQTGAQRAPRWDHPAFPCKVTHPLYANTSGTCTVQPAQTLLCACRSLHNHGRNTTLTNVSKRDYPSVVSSPTNCHQVFNQCALYCHFGLILCTGDTLVSGPGQGTHNHACSQFIVSILVDNTRRDGMFRS